MQTLEFINPEFRTGLNVTVRNGPKHAEALKPGDLIQIAQTIVDEESGDRSAEKIGYAEVFDVRRVASIDQIPEIWLRLEHDKSCQSRLGLIQAMDRAYPEGWGDEGLTVVMFLKLKK